jgi:DNA repair exonuclease SbcCD nuclease subunit
MKIVVTSDWHLDALTDGVQRADEISNLVDQSVKIAIEEAASLYVFCGDLCNPDGWNAIRAMAKSIDVALELSSNGIPSIWVAGNHDVSEDGLGTTTLTPLASADVALHVFEQPGELTFDGTNSNSGSFHVVGLPFTPSSHKYDPEKTVKKMTMAKMGEPTLVLGHLNLKGISAGSETKELARGREVYWPVEIIKKKWPGCIIVGGHYHYAQVFEGVNIVGSLARIRHDEEDHNPSVMLLDLEV